MNITDDKTNVVDFPVKLDPAQIISADGNTLRTTSLHVAEVFGKRHDNVISKVESLDCSSEFSVLNFKVCSKNNELQNGKPQKYFEMTKDGFMFLVMGFTGKKAAQIKEAYINAFNFMAEKLFADKVEAKSKVKTQKALPNGLTTDQQTTIKTLVKSRAESLPESKRAKGAITCWSALKSKFGCSYKEIEPGDFTEAVSLIARLVLDGEYIAKGERPESQAYERISPEQYRQISSAIRQAFAGWIFSCQEEQTLFNRIRAQYSLSRFEDLPADKVNEVLSMVAGVRAMNIEFLTAALEIKRQYLTEYVAAGAPWTPNLKRKWRKIIGTQLPDRPNWLEVQRRVAAQA